MNTLGLDHPRIRTAFRSVKMLVGCYLGISVLTLAAVVLLRDDAAVVNDTVWIRGILVVVSALVMTALTARTARGSSRAYIRLRIASALMVVAIAVLVAIPGMLPPWMKIEQSVCGLALLGVVAVVNGKQLRSLFAAM
jgi:hypothetical protein